MDAIETVMSSSGHKKVNQPNRALSINLTGLFNSDGWYLVKAPDEPFLKALLQAIEKAAKEQVALDFTIRWARPRNDVTDDAGHGAAKWLGEQCEKIGAKWEAYCSFGFPVIPRFSKKRAERRRNELK